MRKMPPFTGVVLELIPPHGSDEETAPPLLLGRNFWVCGMAPGIKAIEVCSHVDGIVWGAVLGRSSTGTIFSLRIERGLRLCRQLHHGQIDGIPAGMS